MTFISSPSAALTILSQASSPASTSTGRATDAILDIVSKAKTATSGTPHAAGGTVSSEISRAASSAMSAGVVSSFNPDDPKIAFRPYEANAENAEGFAKAILSRLGDYNAQFHPVKVLNREEYNALIESSMAGALEKGADPVWVQQQRELRLSDDSYQRRVASTIRGNEAELRQSKSAQSAMGYLTQHLSATFGVNVQISYDERGEASIGAFEYASADGLAVVSYDGKGELSVRK